MSADDASLNGTIRFLQHEKPALLSGDYELDITQNVAISGSPGASASYFHQRKFSVAGPQFSLAPGAIASVFPPEGSRGEYANILPHVVLTSTTLPWQRSVYSSEPAYADNEDIPTWLALILIDEEDPAPAVNDQATIQQLLTTGDAAIFSPAPETSQPATDPCVTIDLSVDFFNLVAPSINDLKWLAHVRELASVENKAFSRDTPPTIDYSVVLGNRLPKMGNLTTVHLVSLEDFQPYLPADDGAASTNFPAGTTTVRLVSLKSWTFSAVEEQHTFGGLLQGLSLSPPTLQMPSAKVPPASDADRFAANAFALGYTALNHDLRDGDKTVSWYRGPLVPFPVSPEISLPAGASDALTQYDPQTGMFDMSLSAAWQLGRMLALQNRTFAVSLYQWKSGQTFASSVQAERNILQQLLSAGDGEIAYGRALTKNFATSAVSTALSRLKSKTKPQT